MLDVTDLRNCRVGLHWIQSFRATHGQPPHPAYARALAALDAALASSPNGTEPVAAEDNWLTTEQVAEQLGCSTRYVRRIAEQLGATKPGREWRYPPL
jgi:excisionase family DNA binding protein